MKTLYFDCFSGISGDMTVGALLDLGLPIEALRDELSQLDLAGYSIDAEGCFVNGIGATKFNVKLNGSDHGHEHHHRSYSTIRKLIEDSRLSSNVKERSIEIFQRLAVAEGSVHGVDPETVHFHEVGAIDSIVDIVGAAVGFCHFGIEAYRCSRIPLGSAS